MEKINASQIISKWSIHNSGNVETIQLESAPPLGEVGTEFSRINRRRNIASHRGQKRDKNALAVEEAVQKSKKFSLALSVLRNPSKEYSIYSCKSCLNLLEFTDVAFNQSSRKSINLLEHITRKTRKSYLHWIAPAVVFSSKEKQRLSGQNKDKGYKPSFVHCYFTWHTMKNLASCFDVICIQRSDQLSLREARKKDHPIIFVHSERSLFGSVLLHLYLSCIDTMIPATVLKDDCVKSSLIKYFMQKMGFIFMESDESNLKETVEVLLDQLESRCSILIPCRPYQYDTEPQPNVMDLCLNAQRKNDSRLDRALLSTIALSKEQIFSSKDNSPFTLKNIFCSLWKHRLNFGLLHINVSQGLKLKSLLRVAKDLNQQEEVHEENNLIARHLNLDMMETQSVLPISIVSCLLCSKYRNAHGVSLQDLSNDVEIWTEKLKESSKNIGFCGEAMDITSHAIELLHQQDLIMIHGNDGNIKPRIKNIKEASLLYQHSLKMLHTFMARTILACTIISECGGIKLLKLSSTHHVTFVGSKILENAESLGEMISFLLDFHCPFNQISDSLTSTIDHFVAMGYIKMQELGYLDNYHQRLARSAQFDSELGEEDVGERNNEIVYELEMHEDLLTYYQFLQPFVELSFTVLALIKEEFTDETFQVSGIYSKIKERYDAGFFEYGEMVHMEFVSRFCDYLFETEVIDDEKDWYTLSQHHKTNGDELLLHLQRISKLRS